MKNPLKTFKAMSRARKTSVAALFATGVFIFTGADSCDSTPTSQNAAQSDTEAYFKAARDAVPYPLDAMKKGGWTERRLLTEHLLRQNDPNGVRYAVWTTQNGQVMGSWPVRGMIFDPNSQLSNSQSISWSSNGGSGVVAAPGDNGTYGPEAMCYAFFTPSGSEVQLPCTAIVVESDTPLNITTQPLITYNVTDKPKVATRDGLKGIGDH